MSGPPYRGMLCKRRLKKRLSSWMVGPNEHCLAWTLRRELYGKGRRRLVKQIVEQLFAPTAKEGDCPNCFGLGEVVEFGTNFEDCEDCDGTGKET